MCYRSAVNARASLCLLSLALVSGVARADEPKPVAPARPALGLRQCIALTDARNPQIKQAIDRLEQAHAQLDEIKWIPWSQFSVSGGVALVPTVQGSQIYSPQSSLFLQGNGNWGAAWKLQVDALLPLWTFGKIENANKAAKAYVDLTAADVERWRLLVHHDVRRAYFGLQFAKDAAYILDFAEGKLDEAIKQAEGDDNTDEVDVLRLKTIRAEIDARRGEIEKGTRTAVAALRFLTGIAAPAPLDIADEPLAGPKQPLVDVLVYLKSARTHRPELTQVRFGVEARKAQVELAKARLLPDIGIAASFGYSSSPLITPQTNPFVNNPTNYLGYGGGIVFRWNLDLLPAAARVRFAEAQLAETRDLESYALGGVGVEVETAYGQAKDATIREQSYGKAESFAKRWVATVSSAIAIGTKEERDLIDPLRTYLNDRIAHLQALYDLDVTVSQLTVVTGDESLAVFE